jgi:hypothetical protein
MIPSSTFFFKDLFFFTWFIWNSSLVEFSPFSTFYLQVKVHLGSMI